MYFFKGVTGDYIIYRILYDGSILTRKNIKRLHSKFRAKNFKLWDQVFFKSGKTKKYKISCSNKIYYLAYDIALNQLTVMQNNEVYGDNTHAR